MRDAKEGVGCGPTSGCDAIEWFVENESDRALDEAAVLKWEDWCAHPENEAEYIRVVKMCLQVRRLSAPSTVGGKVLVRDALAEPGAES
jgi:ferric-dicitrate binding protein FerR (iron transport regulator)